MMPLWVLTGSVSGVGVVGTTGKVFVTGARVVTGRVDRVVYRYTIGVVDTVGFGRATGGNGPLNL